MKRLIAVTDRRQCPRDFFEQIHRLCLYAPDRIILREKDLSDSIYYDCAARCREICAASQTPLSVSGRPHIAGRLNITDIHLSYTYFMENKTLLSRFHTVGVSVHSVSEAVCSAKAGASYLIAGHIFATDCKKGVPPRGLDFLREVCTAVHALSRNTSCPEIPVYGIGGITFDRLDALTRAGAAGGCMMSQAMKL